jgi:phosphate/sulfate permease
LRSHVVFYSKVALLAIGVAIVIGIVLCSAEVIKELSKNRKSTS